MTLILQIEEGKLLAGVGGESNPRFDLSSKLVQFDLSFSLSSSSSTSFLQELKVVCIEELYNLIHEIFRIKPKEWRCLLLEGNKCSTRLIDTLKLVITRTFSMKCISIQPVYHMPILTTGCNSGIIFNFGKFESHVVAIYDSRPILSTFQSSNMSLHKICILYSQYMKSKYLNDNDNAFTYEFIESLLLKKNTINSSISSNDNGDITIPATISGHNESVILDNNMQMIPLDAAIFGRCYGIGDHSSSHDGMVDMIDEEDEVGGLAGLLLSCIERCPIDVRLQAARHVVVYGEGADIPGFREMLCEKALIMASSSSSSSGSSSSSTDILAIYKFPRTCAAIKNNCHDNNIKNKVISDENHGKNVKNVKNVTSGDNINSINGMSGMNGFTIKPAQIPFRPSWTPWIGGSLFSSLKRNDSTFN